jgi:hypothetical protein
VSGKEVEADDVVTIVDESPTKARWKKAETTNAAEKQPNNSMVRYNQMNFPISDPNPPGKIYARYQTKFLT